MDALQDLVFFVDMDRKILHVNEASCHRLGYSRAELIGTDVLDLHPEARRAESLEVMTLLMTGEREFCPVPLITKDGNLIYVQTRVSPTMWQGQPALLGISRDVGEQKRAEEELEYLNEFLSMLMRMARDFINVPVARQNYAIDRALAEIGAMTKTDRAYLFKYDFEKRIACNTHEWCAEGIEPQMQHLQDTPMEMFPDWLERHMRGEELYIDDVDSLPPDSGMGRILQPQNIKSLSTFPLMSEGECFGFVGFDSVRAVRRWTAPERDLLRASAELFANFEIRRRTEDELRRVSEARAMLLDTMDVQVWHLDGIDKYGMVNRAHCEFTGLTRESMENRPIAEFFPADVVEICKVSNQEVYDKRRTIVTEELVPNAAGDPRLLQIVKSPKLNAGGEVEYVVCVANDITELRNTRDALERSEKRYRGLLESQHNLIVRVDCEGRFTYVNNAYCQTFGKTREELLGGKFTPLIHPDDVGPTLKAMEGLYAPPHRITIEQRAMTAEGWRWIAWEDDAILDEDGNVVEIQGVGTDITDQKQNELNLIAARDAAEAASQAKSIFVGNMSHEIRTPLNAILGYAQILDVSGDDHELRERGLAKIMRGGEHLLELIDNILTIVRSDRNELPLREAEFELESLINDLVEMAMMECHESEYRVHVEMSESVPGWICADKGKVSQVILNLIGNALKFSDGGDIRISVSARASDDDRHPQRQEVRISIIDQGCGIEEEMLAAIFDPFEQTTRGRQVGSGSGLGLPICKLYAEAMGGGMDVRSELNKGSEFIFSFQAEPISQKARRPLPDSNSIRSVSPDAVQTGPRSKVYKSGNSLELNWSALTRETRRSLLAHIESGEIQLFRERLSELPSDCMAHAKTLRDLAEKYDYERIAKVLGTQDCTAENN